MNEATFSVYITRGIVQYAARQGVNPDELCAAVGIEPGLLQRPDQQIPGTLHNAVWQEAIKRTGDENLGLHLGEVFNLATFGIVGYVLVNCQTFREVLEKLSRYTRLFSQGARIHVSESEGMAICDCDVVDDLRNYLVDQPRHGIESTFTSLLTATETLTGLPLRPHSIWFQYPRPADISEHERIFQTGMRFSMPTNRIIFNGSCLNWPVLSANSNLLSMFEIHAESMLDAMNQNNCTQQVVKAIVHQLKGESPSIEIIARSLAVSTRQLQRELQAEGTSFQQLLDRTRQELALRHLKNVDTPIYDVAFLLGFSEPSAFHRAFKRWTGQTPRNYRLTSA